MKLKKPIHKIDPRDRLILKMLAAFEGLGYDGMARIDARLWAAYFGRRARRLGIKKARKA